MAQLLLQGTNFVNFIGYYAWLGTAGGVSGVQVTEWEEPQAVIGSYLQKYAYPDNFRRHQALQQRLQTAHEHAGDADSLPAAARRVSLRCRRQARYAGLRCGKRRQQGGESADPDRTVESAGA